jgi:hypothetical protein
MMIGANQESWNSISAEACRVASVLGVPGGFPRDTRSQRGLGHFRYQYRERYAVRTGMLRGKDLKARLKSARLRCLWWSRKVFPTAASLRDLGLCWAKSMQAKKVGTPYCNAFH